MKIHTFTVQLGALNYFDEPERSHKVFLSGTFVWECDVDIYSETEGDVMERFADRLAEVMKND